MSKKIVLLLVIAAMLTACENNVNEDLTSAEKKVITFSCEGDFGNATFTRATLTADEKNMTDLWVLDYMGGTLQQQLHQVSTDEDFGTPSLSLDYGAHHVYFVASRGEGAELSTSAHKITWTKPLDTFYKDFQITVSAATSGSHSVALDRAVTKLKISVNDEIPSDISNITVTPTTWYYGIDYLTGGPAAAQVSAPRTIAIPESKVGTTGQTNVSIYGFSGATEWTTDVTVMAKNSSNEVIGTASITGAPFKVNRVTNYAGDLFSGGGAFTLSLNGTWEDDFTGGW